MPFDLNARVSAYAAALVAALVAMPAAATSPAVLTRGAASCHELAFTFDLCPVSSGSGFDAPLVKFLIEHRVHATFFASGKWMASHDAELRQLIAEPFFEIGTHGQEHAHLKKLSPKAQAAEISGPVAFLAQRYGVHATAFRPPYGEYNDDTVKISNAAGQNFVMWSVVSGDPDPKLSAPAIVSDVVSRAKNGSIIIFHANGRGWKTDNVFPAVYQQLVVKKGFATETVAELLNGCDVPVKK